MRYIEAPPNEFAGDVRNHARKIAMAVREILLERAGLLTAPGPGPAMAPADASFVVMSLNPVLTAQRVLMAGTNVTIEDGGAVAGWVKIHSTGGGPGGGLDHPAVMNRVSWGF